MKRSPRPLRTRKTTSATPSRMASCSWRTPSTTWEPAFISQHVYYREQISETCVSYFGWIFTWTEVRSCRKSLSTSPCRSGTRTFSSWRAARFTTRRKPPVTKATRMRKSTVRWAKNKQTLICRWKRSQSRSQICEAARPEICAPSTDPVSSGWERHGSAREREMVPREAGRGPGWASDRGASPLGVLPGDRRAGRIVPGAGERDVCGRLHFIVLVGVQTGIQEMFPF